MAKKRKQSLPTKMELLKPTNRQQALKVLAECKKREARMKLVTIRKDKQTVVLMSTTKAKKLGLINGKK